MKHRRFVAALLGATMLCGVPERAKADPISAAILTFAGIEATATAVAVTTFGLGLAASAALSYVGSLIKGNPASAATASTSTVGTQVNVQYGATVPRSRIFGRQLTGGQFGFWNLSGADNKFLDIIYHVGDGPHHSLAGMIANGKPCTFGAPDAIGIPVNEFNSPDDGTPRMWVQFHQGFEDQAADARLVATANPVGRWTADDTLAGVASVRVTLQYDEKVFPGGSLPSLQFDVKGALLYDPRKDSTNGGFGSHRWTDQHSWEWSDNPSVGLYNHQRGLYLNGELMVGEGLAPFDLINEMYMTAANACDENVSLKGGGTEKRYRVAMNVGADQQHTDVIRNFLDAMAGQLLEQVGAFGPIAGVAQAVALPTLTDADLIDGKPVKFSAKRSRSELINAVFGSYTDPDQQYSMIPYPPRTSAADEAADGERLAGPPVDYPQVQSGTQAQRLGEIKRRLSRAQATATITVRYRWLVADPGDWLPWDSGNSARGHRVYRVDSRVINDDRTVTLQLREINSGVYAFNPDVDQLDPTVPGDLPGFGALLTTVSGFDLEAVQVFGNNGLVVPALRCLWSPTSDRSIVKVLVQYRVKTLDDSGLIRTSEFIRPDGGEGLIYEGIQAGTVFQARATIVTNPPRFTTFTDWRDQLASSQHVVPTATNALHAAFDALDAGVKYNITALQNQFSGELRDLRSLFARMVAQVAARSQINKQIGNQQAWDHRADLISRIKVGDDALGAEIVHTQSVMTAADAAQALDILDITAKVGPGFSNVNTVAQAISGLDTTYGGITSDITAKLGPGFSNVNTVAAAISGVDSTYAGITSGITAKLGPGFSNVNTVAAAISGVDSTYGGITSDITAKLGTGFSNVNTVSGAVATLNGYAAHVTVKTNVNGYIVGTELINGGAGLSAFTVQADKFQFQLPGYFGSAPVSVLSIGTLAGVPAFGFTGNMWLDGVLTARMIAANVINAGHIQAGSFTSDSGVFGALSIKSLSLGDNAVTVPKVQTIGTISVVTVGVPQTIASFNVVVDVTGLSGKNVTVYANCVFEQSVGGGSGAFSTAATLLVNGVSVCSYSYPNGAQPPVFPLAGSSDVTVGAGVTSLSVPVSVSWQPGVNSGSSTQVVGGTLFAMAVKR
jgi:hypothetical protein